MTAQVTLREVEDADLPAFFAQQADEASYRMAATTPRDRDAFDAHWRRIRADPATTLRTILLDGAVAGHLVAWSHDGAREVGYWVDRALWGRGIATQALRLFLDLEPTRPLTAAVAAHNAGSLAVLSRAGFRIDSRRLTDDGTEMVRLVYDGH